MIPNHCQQLDIHKQESKKPKILFKAIEEKKTCIKTKYKAFANCLITNSNTKF